MEAGRRGRKRWEMGKTGEGRFIYPAPIGRDSSPIGRNDAITAPSGSCNKPSVPPDARKVRLKVTLGRRRLQPQNYKEPRPPPPCTFSSPSCFHSAPPPSLLCHSWLCLPTHHILSQPVQKAGIALVQSSTPTHHCSSPSHGADRRPFSERYSGPH